MDRPRGINVVVYDKETDNLVFLEDFFRKRKGFKPLFIDSIEEFPQRTGPATVFLTSLPGGYEALRKRSPQVPTVALISGDVRDGLKTAAKCNVDFYLLSPFHEYDLELKIERAVERRSFIDSLYAEKRDLEAIVELTRLISSTLDPKEVLYLLVRKLSEMMEVSRCSVISIGFGEKRYAHVVSSFEEPGISNITLDLKKYPEIRAALSSKKPVVIQNALKDPIMKPVRAAITELGIRSIVVVPIIFRDEIIGTLFLRTSRSSTGFSQREVSICNAVANVSANLLYNAFLFEKLDHEKARLERLAITDYLTGVYNIRYFYTRLEEEFSRAERYGHPISCIMLDIDHFKKINDTFGHRRGDAVLREFAQLVRKHTRKSDVFARYGGEEFIILLPQTPLDGAEREARRIRAYMAKHDFKGIRKEKISSSIGIACWPVHDVRTPDDLITLADNALFEAKSKGRDRIEVSRALRKKADR